MRDAFPRGPCSPLAAPTTLPTGCLLPAPVCGYCEPLATTVAPLLPTWSWTLPSWSPPIVPFSACSPPHTLPTVASRRCCARRATTAPSCASGSTALCANRCCPCLAVSWGVGPKATGGISTTTQCAPSWRPPLSPSSSALSSCSTRRAPATYRWITTPTPSAASPGSPSEPPKSWTAPTRAPPRSGATSARWSRRCAPVSRPGASPHTTAPSSPPTASTAPRCSRSPRFPTEPWPPRSSLSPATRSAP